MGEQAATVRTEQYDARSAAVSAGYYQGRKNRSIYSASTALISTISKCGGHCIWKNIVDSCLCSVKCPSQLQSNFHRNDAFQNLTTAAIGQDRNRFIRYDCVKIFSCIEGRKNICVWSKYFI